MLVLSVALLVGPAPVAGASDNATNVTAYRATNATLTRVGGQTVLNVTANLSHGGTVAVLNEACERTGARYDIPPGVERRVTIELWHENGTKVQTAPDEYGVLVRAQREGAARAAVYHGPTARTSVGFEGTCETPTPRPLPESVAPSTATTTSTQTTTEARSTTTTPSSTATTTGGGPGFGVVAALVSLVAVASLAVRRRAKL